MDIRKIKKDLETMRECITEGKESLTYYEAITRFIVAAGRSQEEEQCFATHLFLLEHLREFFLLQYMEYVYGLSDADKKHTEVSYQTHRKEG